MNLCRGILFRFLSFSLIGGLAVLAFSPTAFAQFGTTLTLEDAPVIPAVSIIPLPNEQAAQQLKRSASDNLEGAMKKANADIATMDAKIFPLATQARDLAWASKNPQSDDSTRKAAADALVKVVADLEPMQKDYAKMQAEGAALCASQFSVDKSAYFSLDENKKSDINKMGFSCASGERMIADNVKNKFLPCSMQVGKVQGSFGFRSGPMGAIGAVATACSAAAASMTSPPPEPSEKVACVNEKNQVVASSVVMRTRFGPFLTKNSRYSFDQQGRVIGWKTVQGDFTSQVTIKGDKIEKTNLFKDMQVSKCEWAAQGDLTSGFFTNGRMPDPTVKPSNLTQ